jgi:6-phosphogluconolactonase (cycloisomerase 2 family)
MQLTRVPVWFSIALGISTLLSCGATKPPSPSPAPTSEILYTLDNGIVSTYSIDPSALTATLAEQPASLVPASSSLMQFAPSPDDHYVYVVWSDAQNLQHLSVFQTDSSGVPQLPHIQTLNANSLSQFNMHPNGRFAYMLEVTTSGNSYQAYIRLFEVQQGRGTLKESSQVQGSYGPSVYWPAFLYGFSTDGTKLYDASTVETASIYRQRAIDLTTGALGADKQIFQATGNSEVVIRNVIVDQYQTSITADNFLAIYPDTPNPAKATIRCTMAMLSACATATNVQLDPSGRYLFLTDPAKGTVQVATFNLSTDKIRNTGYSIPMPAETPGLAFSPDGSIVYALGDDQAVHFYHFDAQSGSLTEGGTPLPLSPGSGICPARY